MACLWENWDNYLANTRIICSRCTCGGFYVCLRIFCLHSAYYSKVYHNFPMTSSSSSLLKKLPNSQYVFTCKMIQSNLLGGPHKMRLKISKSLYSTVTFAVSVFSYVGQQNKEAESGTTKQTSWWKLLFCKLSPLMLPFQPQLVNFYLELCQSKMKQARKLQATLVRNYESPTDRLTGVKCRL